ncbi:MAG: zinc ribbon domain-containing protein [Candidatus Heimdallarchaeota archaeon]|nr:zinc ribbon domain-containing protein [Candidatus Heimdallarchaeota archaeon]
MFCQNCGEKLGEKSKCGNCGYVNIQPIKKQDNQSSKDEYHQVIEPRSPILKQSIVPYREYREWWYRILGFGLLGLILLLVAANMTANAIYLFLPGLFFSISSYSYFLVHIYLNFRDFERLSQRMNPDEQAIDPLAATLATAIFPPIGIYLKYQLFRIFISTHYSKEKIIFPGPKKAISLIFFPFVYTFLGLIPYGPILILLSIPASPLFLLIFENQWQQQLVKIAEKHSSI